MLLGLTNYTINYLGFELEDTTIPIKSYNINGEMNIWLIGLIITIVIGTPISLTFLLKKGLKKKYTKTKHTKNKYLKRSK